MAKGALYWRIKDEKTGKWFYTRAVIAEECSIANWVLVYQYEEEE